MDSYLLKPGSLLQGGKYKIHSVLGQGGFGITYLAEQTGLGMKVAIKEFYLKGSCQRNSATSRVDVPVTDNRDLVYRCLKKFKAEAKKIASLNNDHIVNIIDIFDENGTSYYVMKYLGGGSLAQLIQLKALPEDNALNIIRQISDALISVHSAGLLHLDIKPANILFDERGRAVLIDFGVSKYVDHESDTSTTSSLVGFSRGFAPLEQINATVTSLSPASDIYALGATLYNMITGSVPPDASEIMNNGLPEMDSGISPEVCSAIKKAMQPRTVDRPKDVYSFLNLLPVPVEEVADDETRVVQGTGDSQVTTPGTGRGNSWFRYLSIAFFTIAVALTIFNFVYGRNGIGGNRSASSGSNDNRSVAELNAQIKSLSATNINLQKQVADLKKQSSQSSSATVNDLQEQVKTLKKQVTDLRSQVSTLTQKNNSLQNENSNLKTQVASYKPDAERWRRQLEMN